MGIQGECDTEGSADSDGHISPMAVSHKNIVDNGDTDSCNDSGNDSPVIIDGVAISPTTTRGTKRKPDTIESNGKTRHLLPSLDLQSTDGTPVVIEQIVPDGVKIAPTPYGLGLYTTRFFPKGSLVYVGRNHVIPNKKATFILKIDGQAFDLDSDTHSVAISEQERTLYTFDSFMNHSCEPTTCSRPAPGEEANYPDVYGTYTTRDVNAGEQITCDYLLFEYDMKGKEIEQCGCGTPSCIGAVKGFKFLTPEQQASRIEDVDESVLEWMANDNPNVRYITEINPPPQIRVEKVTSSCFREVVTRPFRKGETIFTRKADIISEDTQIIMKVHGTRLWMGPTHIVPRPNNLFEFYDWDSFQNHSCEPNTLMVYEEDGDSYRLVANGDIAEGDELTSDYETFDDNLDGARFNCLCGTKSCRGIVKA